MKKLFLLFAFSLFVFKISYSQNTSDDFNYQIYYQTTSQDTAVFDSLCIRVCKVTVQDISNVAFVKVKVGTVEGESDIIQYDFAIDVTSGLPTGLSFNREQNIIYLGLQETYQADTYYYEIQLEDNSGNTSVIKKWN